MDKTIKNKLRKKFRKELEEAIAERLFLDEKINTLKKIVEAIDEMEEDKE